MALCAGTAVNVEAQDRRWLELMYVFKDRMWRRNIKELEQVGDRVPVELARAVTMDQQRPELAGEGESPLRLKPVERLFAQAVSHEPKHVIGLTPVGERKHSDQPAGRFRNAPVPASI